MASSTVPIFFVLSLVRLNHIHIIKLSSSKCSTVYFRFLSTRNPDRLWNVPKISSRYIIRQLLLCLLSTIKKKELVNRHGFKWLQLDSNPEPLSSLTKTQPLGQTGQIFDVQISRLLRARNSLTFRQL